ncbi:MAG: glycosyltransferase family 2 protein [Lachnospiraceae bacterium]|nr:glycosyltransferase family 2 protein [Lachnospiraceae bacterium]
MDKLYIIIPAYNESETIESVIKEWYPIVEKAGEESKLVIINDGSKDNTYEIMQKLAKDYKQFEPVTKPNGGHGATILFGYNYALNQGADYIFQTDSDGQTLPSEFQAFWDERENYDMVIGHRKGRQDGFSRIIVTKTLKLVCKLCFGVTLTDANTPFRLMKREALASEIGYIPKDYNLTNVIISVLFAKHNKKVLYKKITFRPRQGGVNSINIKKIFKIGQKALKDFKAINTSIKNSGKEA